MSAVSFVTGSRARTRHSSMRLVLACSGWGSASPIHGPRPRPRRATPLTLSARGGQGVPAGRLVEASMTHTAQTSSG